MIKNLQTILVLNHYLMYILKIIIEIENFLVEIEKHPEVMLILRI